jgi:hypothetical protein
MMFSDEHVHVFFDENKQEKQQANSNDIDRCHLLVSLIIIVRLPLSFEKVMFV